MEAGREAINAKVATGVMGWRMCPVPNAFLGFRQAWVDGKSGAYRAELSWSPYDDIAAAWEVVEKMHSEGYLMGLITYPGPNGKIAAYFRKESLRLPHKWFERRVRSIEEDRLVPHAICLAALEVKGVKVE